MHPIRCTLSPCIPCLPLPPVMMLPLIPGIKLWWTSVRSDFLLLGVILKIPPWLSHLLGPGAPPTMLSPALPAQEVEVVCSPPSCTTTTFPGAQSCPKVLLQPWATGSCWAARMLLSCFNPRLLVFCNLSSAWVVENTGKKEEKAFSSFIQPSSSWALMLTHISQALSLPCFHGVKEATRSLEFTCLWGSGRAALRDESCSLLLALWLAWQTMGVRFCSSNSAAFLCHCLSWHLAFEMEKVASGFYPVSWALIQLLQEIQDFCGQLLFF